MDLRIKVGKRWFVSPIDESIIIGGKDTLIDYLDSMFRKYGYEGVKFKVTKDSRYEKFNISTGGSLVGEIVPHYYDDVEDIDYPDNIIEI